MTGELCMDLPAAAMTRGGTASSIVAVAAGAMASPPAGNVAAAAAEAVLRVVLRHQAVGADVGANVYLRILSVVN